MDTFEDTHDKNTDCSGCQIKDIRSFSVIIGISIFYSQILES